MNKSCTSVLTIGGWLSDGCRVLRDFTEVKFRRSKFHRTKIRRNDELFTRDDELFTRDDDADAVADFDFICFFFF